MKNLPLVSVIMGTYNAEDTVERAINSIKNQTYTNWEFIICDDGSSDLTPKILQEMGKNETRIRILKNQNNMRLAYSLNRCLEQCGGKYIARMDADDISLPSRIQEQVDFLEKNPEYDVVGCNRIVFDENGDCGVRKSEEIPSSNALLYGPPYGHPTIMMKKDVFDALGGYTVSKEAMRAEDLDLWFRFYSAGYKGYNIQKPLLKYQELTTDFKKRTFIAGLGTAKVFLDGYKLLGFSKIKYLYILKPIITSLIPPKIMSHYQKEKLDHSLKEYF